MDSMGRAHIGTRGGYAEKLDRISQAMDGISQNEVLRTLIDCVHDDLAQRRLKSLPRRMIGLKSEISEKPTTRRRRQKKKPA